MYVRRREINENDAVPIDISSGKLFSIRLSLVRAAFYGRKSSINVIAGAVFVSFLESFDVIGR